MAVEFHEVKGRYIDSVLLMQVTRELEKEPNVEEVAVMTATSENIEIFENIGFHPPENVENSSILIAVKATDEETASKTVEKALELLDRRTESSEVENYTLSEMESLVKESDFPILFISTPGKYVDDIAKQALEKGINLHIFSSNVPIETELELKKIGHEKGLFVLGPDAGTTIIQGQGLGFSNIIRKGNVGVVGSSGTGIQELTVLLDKGGLGINVALGVGTNDFTEEIDAIMTKQGIELLQDSSMIIVVAKKPNPIVMKGIIKILSKKPSVFVALGDNESYIEGETFVTGYLDDAVNFALKHANKGPLAKPEVKMDFDLRGRKYVRGMFVGGSLCYQAQAILKKNGVNIYSNAPLDKEHLVEGKWNNLHAYIDIGAEEYVEGRPHPMIDPRFRNEMILKECKKDDVAVVLFDVMLGYGSAMDPLDGLEDIPKGPVLLASIIGTDKDLQDYVAVERRLKKLGVKVFTSAQQTAEFAAKVLEEGQ
jgi:succinyl-CoA synthetase alpha subunit